MRKFLCIATILILLITTLSSCSVRHGYYIYNKEGQYFLHLSEEYERYKPGRTTLPGIVGSTVTSYVLFYSVEEMYNDIWTGSFTDEEFLKIADMHSVDQEDLPLPNLDNLYEATLSDLWETTNSNGPYIISWRATDYSFTFWLGPPYSCDLVIRTSSESAHQQLVEEYSALNVYEKHTVEADGNRYTVFCKSNESAKTMNLYIFGISNGQYFEAKLLNAKQYPSDEMIAGIGLKPFSE